jgi:hypothetical protein
MGLDTVELAIRFEQAFGITIPDEDAGYLTTPRQVTYYVLSQLRLATESRCMTQQAFYLVRKEFVPVLGIRRSEFHPRANLERLIPIHARKEIWTTLRVRLGDHALLDLVRPPWLFSLLSFATIAIGVATFVTFASNDFAFLLSALMSISFGYGAAVLTRPLKRNFRSGYEQAGALAKHLALHSPHRFKKEWTREEVAQLVRQIVIDQTGVENFTEDSRFVEDMHLD